ncbi:MAG: hypothetical protein AAGE84_20745 [Cyanobacteria bacterium P01_G01_bin.39]
MPNPNKPNSNVNSHGKPRINLDERIAKKQSRVHSANDKFRNNFRASNKQIAVSSGEAIEDRLLYEASKDLEEQLLDEQYDAVVRANNRYAAMVNNAVGMLEAEEDENVRLLTEVEDDVIDADFEEIKVALPARESRFTSSRFLSASNETKSLASADKPEDKKTNKYQVELPE